MDPVSYPKITIGGKEYDVKFRQWDIIQLLKVDGLNLFDLRAIPLMSIEGFERNAILLKHAIAHQVEMTTEDVMKGLDMGQAGEEDQILAQSIKKAQAQITAARPLGPILVAPPAPPLEQEQKEEAV